MPFISLIGIVIIIYICYLYFKALNRLKNFLGQPLFQLTCVSLFGPHALMTRGAHLYEQLPPFFIILVLALTVAVGLYVGLKKKANLQFNTTNMIPNVIFWIFSMVVVVRLLDMAVMISMVLLSGDYATFSFLVIVSNLANLTPCNLFVLLLPDRALFSFFIEPRALDGTFANENFDDVVMQSDLIPLPQRPAYPPLLSQGALEGIPEEVSVFQLTDAEEEKAVNYIQKKCLKLHRLLDKFQLDLVFIEAETTLDEKIRAIGNELYNLENVDKLRVYNTKQMHYLAAMEQDMLEVSLLADRLICDLESKYIPTGNPELERLRRCSVSELKQKRLYIWNNLDDVRERISGRNIYRPNNDPWGDLFMPVHPKARAPTYLSYKYK